MEKKLTFWIEDDDLNELQKLSVRSERSLGYLARKAVKKYLGEEQ